MREKPPTEGTEVKRKSTSRQPASASVRETVRAKLMKASVLATDLGVPSDIAPVVSDDELELMGDLRPGARSSEALVDEDRGL